MAPGLYKTTIRGLTIYLPGGMEAWMPERDPLLQEREKTHGSFSNVAGTAQDLKSTIRNRRLSQNIDERQAEALDLICTKIARIICGNSLEPDHWKDIAGYAKLGEEACYLDA